MVAIDKIMAEATQKRFRIIIQIPFELKYLQVLKTEMNPFISSALPSAGTVLKLTPAKKIWIVAKHRTGLSGFKRGIGFQPVGNLATGW